MNEQKIKTLLRQMQEADGIQIDWDDYSLHTPYKTTYGVCENNPNHVVITMIIDNYTTVSINESALDNAEVTLNGQEIILEEVDGCAVIIHLYKSLSFVVDWKG